VTGVEIRGGAEQLRDVAKRLKALGDKGLQREFNKQVAASMKTLRKHDIPASALATLPKKNGVNALVAKSSYRLSKSTSLRRYGLRLLAKNQYDLYRIDKGILRHPVFKRKGEESRNAVWVEQRVPPGWFSKPCNHAAPQIRIDVQEAMTHIIKQIEGKERAGAEPLL
jgi:hypothetical protein